MSASAEGVELSVAMPTHSMSDPTPPHNNMCANGVPPEKVANGNITPQLPGGRKNPWNVIRQGISQAPKKGNHLAPRNSAAELQNIAYSLQKKSTGMFQSVSNLFTLSPTIQEDSGKGTYDNDPVVNTIRQLRKEDRRDRDMCCGFAPGFRSAFKAIWMIASVIIVWCGFIGLELCKGDPLTSAYVSAQGFILLIYLGLVEVSGAVAIGKGRRWGVLVLLLSQPLVLLTLGFGYTVLPPVGVLHVVQRLLMVADNSTMVNEDGLRNSTMLAMAMGNVSSNGTAECQENYMNFAMALFALGHLMVVFVLLYSLVACVCLVHAGKRRRAVEPPVITESPGRSPESDGGTLAGTETKL